MAIRRPAASTAALGSTKTDAAILPVSKLSPDGFPSLVFPTTGADSIKGVKVAAGDLVTGKFLFIGSSVATAKLKAYGPTGASIGGGATDAPCISLSGSGCVLFCLNAGTNTWLAW